MRCEEPWNARPRSLKHRATSIIRLKMLYYISDSTLIDASRSIVLSKLLDADNTSYYVGQLRDSGIN